MWSYGVMVITLDFESNNPSSNLGETYIDNLSERLRRWPAKPLLFQRAGSNPAVVVKKYNIII